VAYVVPPEFRTLYQSQGSVHTVHIWAIPPRLCILCCFCAQFQDASRSLIRHDSLRQTASVAAGGQRQEAYAQSHLVASSSHCFAPTSVKLLAHFPQNGQPLQLWSHRWCDVETGRPTKLPAVEQTPFRYVIASRKPVAAVIGSKRVQRTIWSDARIGTEKRPMCYHLCASRAVIHASPLLSG
jgi:hypothetical protein